MNLIIDIGNTRTKIGLFNHHQLKRQLVLDKLRLDDVKEWAARYQIDAAAVSTVAGIGKRVDHYLDKHFNYVRLSHKTPIPIQNRYKTPETLGRDRLAAVIGAAALFPGQHNLVIDAGTCIKYDLVTADRQYFGGSIAPGIEMRLKAMHHFTAKLPLLEKGNLRSFVGTDTKTALQTGAQIGAVAEAEGFIRRYAERYGEVNVILTGGDAQFFAKKLKTRIFVKPHLVLSGLNEILNYNVAFLS